MQAIDTPYICSDYSGHLRNLTSRFFGRQFIIAILTSLTSHNAYALMFFAMEI